MSDIIEKATKILQQPVCDHCLGRQFGQLLSGFSNEERGRMIRSIAAMSIDNEGALHSGMDMSNFHSVKFHSLDLEKHPEQKACAICADIFLDLEKWTAKVAKAASGVEFSTFLVGTKLSFDLVEKEEALWERVGIDCCEPLKAELNREIGKRVEKKTGAKFNSKNPEINIILDFDSNRTVIEINPVFIYGEYQKLVRGIPQTRWPSGKYKTSVEQIIAKPFMAATGGKSHKLHGMGREDIDARCLGWRPFVLEILSPKNRSLDMKKLAKKIARQVRVRNMRPSSIAEVRSIKESRAEKTYRALVIASKNVAKSDLKKLSALGSISQKTPQRVLHRRADKFRKRNVKSVKSKYVSKNKFLLEIRGEAGLYIKELISGDSGRTDPSVSKILGVPCTCKELDVIAIHSQKKSHLP